MPGALIFHGAYIPISTSSSSPHGFPTSKSSKMTPVTKDEFRLLTWRLSEFDNMTIQSKGLQINCPLDNGHLERRAAGNKTNQISHIGDLELLPTEIIHIIFGLLDLQTLTSVRSVSWQMRDLVDSLSTYKAIIQYAPDALRALISTTTADQSRPTIYIKPSAREHALNAGNLDHFLTYLPVEDVAFHA